MISLDFKEYLFILNHTYTIIRKDFRMFSRSLPGDQVLGNYFVPPPPIFSEHATALGRVMNPNPNPSPNSNPSPSP